MAPPHAHQEFTASQSVTGGRPPSADLSRGLRTLGMTLLERCVEGMADVGDEGGGDAGALRPPSYESR